MTSPQWSRPEPQHHFELAEHGQVHYLKHDRRRIARFTRLIFRAILFGLHELEALAATEVIVTVTG